MNENLKTIFLTSEKPSKFFRDLQASGQLKELWPELDELTEVEGSPPYHPEGSVFEHTMQCLDAAAQLTDCDDDEKFMIMLGMLCHDLGKVIRKQGIVASIDDGHDIAGVPLAERVMRRITQNETLIRAVCKLVRYHLVPFAHFQKVVSPDEATKLLEELAPEVTLRHLFLVGWCDIQGCNGNGHEPLSRGQALSNLLREEKNLEIFLRFVEHMPPESGLPVPVLKADDVADLVTTQKTPSDLVRAAYKIQLDEGVLDPDELRRALAGIPRYTA